MFLINHFWLVYFIQTRFWLRNFWMSKEIMYICYFWISKFWAHTQIFTSWVLRKCAQTIQWTRVSLVPRRTLQKRIRFVRQWSDPTLEQTSLLHFDQDRPQNLILKDIWTTSELKCERILSCHAIKKILSVGNNFQGLRQHITARASSARQLYI